ncbi:putative beta-glucosidase [Helianthus annuus]|uniref:Beta-glucosidase n=2 Tax=Helianthus annuus TaxID=4232 RepID=A0A9K3JHT3_HELAN|nr:beta-glucosidase 18 [Helianthus annuus]KAF5814887.1 putative beta-glucosidase [Helianthus annuus]KAJ0944125.1 putative beta-glucosidase [Helianthus annuus]
MIWCNSVVSYNYCKFQWLLLCCFLFLAHGENIKRSDFPDEFLFGVGTSAYQIEGAYLEDGKSLNNWDVFSLSPGTIRNGDNGFIADDHYHQYLKDIELIQSLGVDTYRFSISWSRILPRGRFGDVNPDGIMFYNKILDELVSRGIKPFVTIYHFDFPQELQDRYGSWLSPLMQEDYVHYADTCFKNFGDRVKYWTTMNEPNLFTQMAYQNGRYPPARCSQPFGDCPAGNSDTEPIVVMHNMLLAHGKAVNLYRRDYQHEQGGSVGIVLDCLMYEPLTDNELDQEAARRGLAFSIGWALDPLTFGDYPSEMRQYIGNQLPQFTSAERKFMRNSIDFIGVNHYSTTYAKDCLYSDCSISANRATKGFLDTTSERDGVQIGELTGISSLRVVPRGIGEVVEYLKERYDNKPMFITENGYSEPQTEGQDQDAIQDFKRIEFHQMYLSSLAQAIRDGANVKGYFVWTLMDDFEWIIGYRIKFGLYYIDRQTLARVPKMSAKWYQDFLKNNTQTPVIRLSSELVHNKADS